MDRFNAQVEDIISTLQSLNLLKFWKGQYVVSVSQAVIDQHLRHNHSAKYFAKPESLHWDPKARSAGRGR